MKIYDSLFSHTDMLNEQIARQLFEVLPDTGPVLALVDRGGAWWANDESVFERVFANAEDLGRLCERIDDDGDPVISFLNDCTIVSTDIVLDELHSGYVLILLPETTPEYAMTHIDILEMVLSQVNLIARLVDKNNHFHREKLKHLSHGVF